MQLIVQILQKFSKFLGTRFSGAYSHSFNTSHVNHSSIALRTMLAMVQFHVSSGIKHRSCTHYGIVLSCAQSLLRACLTLVSFEVVLSFRRALIMLHYGFRMFPIVVCATH